MVTTKQDPPQPNVPPLAVLGSPGFRLLRRSRASVHVSGAPVILRQLELPSTCAALNVSLVPESLHFPAPESPAAVKATGTGRIRQLGSDSASQTGCGPDTPAAAPSPSPLGALWGPQESKDLLKSIQDHKI